MIKNLFDTKGLRLVFKARGAAVGGKSRVVTVASGEAISMLMIEPTDFETIYVMSPVGIL